MTELTKAGVVARRSLSDTELADIRALADTCTRHEDVDLRLNWNALQSRADDIAQDFLFYRGGALVGLLALDGLGSEEAEVSGMVHPEHRRTGVFTALAAAAREACRQASTASLVFVCDRCSAAARAFFESLGAAYVFSEQQMRLDRPEKMVPRDPQLDFQKASIADAEAIARIIADDSGMDATYFKQIVARGIQNRARQFYVAKAGGETIGTINIDVIDGDAYIYGFVISPDHRGRGYGKQMLARTIEDVVATRPQPVFLEVETDNAPALALYKSFGFVATRTFDYYRLGLETR